MGDDFYPGRITDLWSSSTSAAGAVYLQWTAPGNDGYEHSTVKTYVIKYSSIAARSPATSDANFAAATSLAPPAPAVQGTLQTATFTGLARGVTYYFAIKAVEADGLYSGLSNGTTAQTAAGCPSFAVVHKTNGPYTTIQSAVDSLPNPLTGYSCVIVQDGATYNEQVNIRNFTNNGSSITVLADPALGFTPVVSPPAASTAAFVIAQASVNVFGISIAPTNAMTYGVVASSGYVAISSVNVLDAGGKISFAGVALSSWSAISYSSVTAGAAHGIELSGSLLTTISYSSAQVNGAGFYALHLNGASSNTVSWSFLTNLAGGGLYADGSNDNVFTHGRVTNAGSGNAFTLIHSNRNFIGSSVITGTAGAVNSLALYLESASSNTITQTSVSCAGCFSGSTIYVSSYNTISGSTFTGTANDVLHLIGAPYNSITQSVISNSNVFGLDLSQGSNANTISFSTLTANGYGFYMGASVGNTVTHGYAAGLTGHGVYLDFGANSNTVSFSTIVANASGMNGLYIDGNNNTATQDIISNPAGRGLTVDIDAIGDVVSYSTVTSNVAGSPAIYLAGTNTSLSQSYVQGSTAVFVGGSTGTVIAGSVLIATGTTGDALYLGGGSAGLALSSSTLIGGGQGAGVRLDGGNSGLVVLSTNQISGAGYGVSVATQTAGTRVFVTSNTIIASISGAVDTYGMAFKGLTTGATVQNNVIYYRLPVDNTGHAACALYAQSAGGLVIDHNRISEPGMLTGGSFKALAFAGAVNSSIIYNDVFSSGTSLNNFYLVQAANASTGLTLRNNVFASSVTVTGTGKTLSVDAGSEAGFVAEYNDYFSSNTLAMQWGASAVTTLAAWKAASAQDAHSFSGHPLWWSTVAGAEDFHPLSTSGRWSPSGATFVNDGADSPTIDAADPADAYAAEVAPNGSRANLGSYGDTAEASRTSAYPGCSVARTVGQGSGTYARIQSAVDSLPTTLTGPACVIVLDGATYPEQVTVQGFSNGGNSLTIKASPGFTPVVAPPAASTAAFQILQSTVNLFGLNVVPTNAMTYGVDASSAYVTISSVNVLDNAGKISLAGAALSDWSSLTYSSVSVQGAHGLMLSGSARTSVSDSTVAANGGSSYALLLTAGASSNTITRTFVSNPLYRAAQLDTNASYNTITLSTITSNAANEALYMNGVTHNVISRAIVSNPLGHGAFLAANVNANTITLSTMTSGAGGYAALYLGAASSNTITQDYVANLSGYGAYLAANSNGNVLSLGTFVSGAAANDALHLIGASSNTVTQDVVVNLSGRAAYLDTNANGNTIVLTMISGGSTFSALYLKGASSNTLTQDTVSNPAGPGAYLDNNSAGNALSLSTVTNAADGYAALSVLGASNLLAGSYVQGSTAVYVGGSTGTVIAGSVLIATSTTGDAVYLGGGSAGLALSSSTLVGGGQGAGVHLDVGGSGLIVLSTNAISGAAYGVQVATQTAGARIFITSNTIVAALSSAVDTYGLAFNGLTSGATVQNNGIYYRAPLNNAGRSAYALYARSAGGLVIDRNRISEPGLATGGSYEALAFVGTVNSSVTYNDVFSSGTSLANFYLVQAAAGSTGLVLRNNVFASSVTVTGSSQTIAVDAASQAGFYADYNDVFSSNTLAFQWGASAYTTLAAWQAGAVQDVHSISRNPLWWSTAAGAEDFHPMSTRGRWNPAAQAFVNDPANAPSIDTGDPSDAYDLEGAPNGSRVNQGSYGDTVEASKSIPSIAGCTLMRNVNQASGPYFTIQSAVGSLPNPLNSFACVIVRDGATYAEQVTVRNFATNGSSITIAADQGSGLTPIVAPPAGSTAAFQIALSSVNLIGLTIVPSNAITYGVVASSAYVTVSSVSVLDAGGKISYAGVSVSSWSTVSYSSVSVLAAHGIALPGSTVTSISYSTAAANGAAFAAVYLNGASTSTLTSVYASNPAGNAVSLDAGAAWNAISDSTMSAAGAGYALYLTGASSNTVTRSVAANTVGGAISLNAGSALNVVTLSSVTSDGAGSAFRIANSDYNTFSRSGVSVNGSYALSLVGASHNTITQDFLTDAGSLGAKLDAASNWNTVSLSTITAVGGQALYLAGASSNTVTLNYVSNAGGVGLQMDGGAGYNTVSVSTLNSAGGARALYVSGASYNTVAQSMIWNTSGDAADLDASAAHNTISLSTLTNTSSGASNWVVAIQGASSNTVTQSYVRNASGNGALLGANAHDNAVSQSTIAVNALGFYALSLSGAVSNAVTGSLVLNPAGDAANLAANSNFNTLALSTFTSAHAGSAALSFTAASSNTVSQAYVANASGDAATLDLNSTGNTISGSTMASAGAGYSALALNGSLSNVVTQSELLSAAGSAARLVSGATGNVVTLSTVTSGASTLPALSIAGLNNTISGSYVQGSTAVYVAGSTGTVVGGSVLVATASNGEGFYAAAGVGLTLSSSTIVGGAQGAGVHVGYDNAGLLVISTNVVSGARYDVFVDRQNGARLFVTSNTIVPSVSGSFDAFGLYLDGLTSGATIQNNGVYYRTAASNAGQTAYALYARNGSGLVIDHNRISQPGMISGGSYEALSFSAVANGRAAYNDVFSSGTGLTNVYLMHAANGSTAWTVADSAFASSVTASGVARLVAVDAGSQGGFAANYNDYFSSNTLSFAWGASAYASLPSWQTASGQDARSFSSNPLWNRTVAGTEDFHPLSTAGRWNPATSGFVADGADSPTTDAADPADSYALEAAPNGSRANIGSYGDTAEASKSAPNFAGCSVTKFVSKAAGPYTSIQAAVGALPASLPGAACVIIEDGATYAEQVTVAGFTNNGSSITIKPDPGTGLTPVVAPPAGSTAAFQIAQSSVNVFALNIAPASAITYGVDATAPYVAISSVNVLDAVGKISFAGVAVSSWSAVSYSSVTVKTAHGLYLAGAVGTTISFSSAAVNGAGDAALYLNGGSSNAVTSGFFANPAGDAGLADASARYNAVSLSTFTTSAAAPYAALVLSNASFNTVSLSHFASSGDTLFLSGAAGNTLSRITSTGARLYLDNSQSNALTQVVSAGRVYLQASYANAVSQSTIAVASAGTAGALQIFASSRNVVTQSFISDAAGHGLVYGFQANNNAVFLSTITGAGVNADGVYAQNSNDDSFSGSYIQGPSAVYFTGMFRPAVGGSTLVASDPAGAAVFFTGPSGNTITIATSTIIGGAQGVGVDLDTGNFAAMVITSNTIIGSQIGVYVAPQDSLAIVSITSNTFVPTVLNGRNTYGLIINGLTSGATVENNSFYYRSQANAGTGVSYALYAQNSAGLLIDHNRVNEPGMLSGGAFAAITLTGTTASQILYNDVFSSGTALSNVSLLALSNASTGVKVRGNVFSSSVTVTGAWNTVSVDAGSQSGFLSDYNDYDSSNTVSFQWGGASYAALAAWQAAAAQDMHSFSANPLWRRTVAGAEDFHPSSTAGRWDPASAAFVADGADSPTIDAGDTADAYAAENAPNGSRANQGSYGGTTEASRSAGVAGCALTREVGKTAGAYAFIQAALRSLPPSLSGPTCVVINDGATYAEQATVQGFTNNGSSITIEAKPGSGLTPVVAPPAGSTAAFQIAQASVNVLGIDVTPTNAMTYGVYASSAYVTVSSVNVRDEGGLISLAGVSISSWSAVSYSSVTAAAAHGFLLPGSVWTTVSHSSAYVQGAFNAAYLNGASSNTFTAFASSSPAGSGVYMDSGAGWNAVSDSVLTGDAAAGALYLTFATNNTVARTRLASVTGVAVHLGVGATSNTISLSTMTAAGGKALDLASASNNTVTRSFLSATSGYGAYFTGANSNTISLSTMTGAGSGAALSLAGNNNVLDQDSVSNASGDAAVLVNASGNVVSRSTITSAASGAAVAALNLGASAVGNTLIDSWVGNPAGQGVLIGATAASNAISRSTVTSAAAGYAAVSVRGANDVLSLSYVQGSTAVFVNGSTGTVVAASVLVATNTAGDALVLAGGSVGLSLSSTTLAGGSLGAGVHLDLGNSGLIIVSTNQISGARYGVLAATQTPTAQLYVTSNTVVPTLSSAFDTYGVYVDGLASGATVQNNGLYYRTSGSAGARTAYALYFKSAAGLNVDHNRVNNPGMLTGGSFTGAAFVGATGASFKFNDLNSRGVALSNAYLLQIANASGVTVKDNIFASSVSVTGSSATITVDAASVAMTFSDYNDFFSSNAWNTGVWGGVAYRLPRAWSLATGRDVRSITANPLWADASAGVEDFHPLSAAGRCAVSGAYGGSCAGFVNDGATSATIDAGDPAEALSGPLGTEPAPAGGAANLGSTGQTQDASKSVPFLCQTTRKVSQSGPYLAIQEAVDSLPNPLTGYSCVLIEDGATYVEQVDVSGFTMNGSSIAIQADPTSGLTPVMDPPIGSTAAFHIAQSSVIVAGINILPTDPMTYGVYASSAYVTISSVNVGGSGAMISQAGVALSSFSRVSYSSITVDSAHGLVVTGSGSAVSYSTSQAAGAAYVALYLNGASGNSFTAFVASNTAGDAALLAAGANGNLLTRSTFAAGSVAGAALHLSASTGNVVTQSFVSNPAGHGAWLDTGANGNTISLSTVTNNSVGSYFALYLNGASSNTLSQSYVSNPSGSGVYLNTGSNYNSISVSSITSGAVGNAALFLHGASYNAVTRALIANPSGHGAYLDTGSNGNTISLSTMTSAAAGNQYALFLNAASSNTVTRSYVANLSGYGAYLQAGAHDNLISLSTMVSAAAGFNALSLQNASYNTVTQSVIANPSGTAAALAAGAGRDTISLSTVTGGGAGYAALSLSAVSSITVSQSYIQGSTAVYVMGSTGTAIGGSALLAVDPTGDAFYAGGGVVGLTLSSSTLVGGAQGAGVHLDEGGSGLVVLSTNAISGAAYGVLVGTQTANAQLYVTSNTIVPTLSAALDTYGLAFNGLTSGATIQNNSVYYRTQVNNAGRSAYALYARSAARLTIDHNRVNEPGMATGGSFTALDFVGTVNSTVTYNDVFSSGTALANFYLVQAAAGSTGLTVRNNAFASSVTVTGSSQTVAIDAASQAGFYANYNDYFSSNTLAFQWGASEYASLPAWQTGAGQDAGSILGNPFWWSTVAGSEDFHPMSTVGRWSPTLQVFVLDTADSPTTDSADPSDDYALEPAPNGSHANQGSYGDTAEASKATPGYPGCVVTKRVNHTAGPYTSLQAAVNALPTTLTGETCVIIRDGATYPEQVTVRGFTNNGSSITIKADPSTGLTPVVDPPAGTAAFVIANSSVNLVGVSVAPTSAVSYGVVASSAYVQIASFTVSDGGGKIAVAALAVSSWNAVSNAVVSVPSAHGLAVRGAMATVSNSVIQTGGISSYGIYLNGASSATVVSVFATNPSGTALGIDANSSSAVVSRSTMTGTGGYGLEVRGRGAVIVDSYIQGSTAAYVAGSTGTVFGGDVFLASNVSGSALTLAGGSVGLSLSTSVLRGGAQGMGLYLDVGGSGLISATTNTISGAQYGLFLAKQAAGAQVYIASNTVLPTLSAARDTYGAYVSGLTTGALLENNAFYYRTAASNAGRTAYAVFAQNSSGLTLDRNRINEPAMITGGSYESLAFSGVVNSTLTYNDVSAEGLGLTNFYQFQAANGSTGLVVRDNVFSSSVTVTGSSQTVSIDVGSSLGFFADYNDYFSSNTLGFQWGVVEYRTLAAWQASTRDADSISANPLWANTAAGAEDFHPKSAAGRFDPAAQAFAADTAVSPTIDAGDPADAYAAESAPNGGRVNLGSYGGTAEASHSALPPASVSLAGVWASSAALQFVDVGAFSYTVDASTDALFRGTVVSSASVAAATLAPQSLFSNTTYYLRAGAVWGSLTVYSPTVVSTPTWSSLLAGTSVYQINASSVVVNWQALPAAPPQASAEGYWLQASTAADFTGTVFSSRTAGVQPSTLTISGLTGGTTYFFRAGSINWSGVPNFAAPVVMFLPVTDVWPPSAITDLTASSTTVEGELLLQWTAPDGNGYVFGASVPAAGYLVRVASFSVASTGGSTTTWWNTATDVRLLAPPALSAVPPVPAFPGTTQQMVIDNLWPGVTYYAMIVSTDQVGNVSDADLPSRTPGAQAGADVFDAPPQPPSGLAASQTSRTHLSVSWTAAPSYDLDYYKVTFDSTPPYDFSHSSTTIVYAPSTSTTLVLLSSGTYVLHVTAVDRGQPRYPGVPLESVATSTVSVDMVVPIHAAQEPFGVSISSDSSGTRICWMPVVRYVDWVPFAVSTAPIPDELADYRVYRATSPTLATWTELSIVATATSTLCYTDAAGAPQYFYTVRAENSTSLSPRSMMRTIGTGSAYIVAPDDASYFEIMPENVSPLEGNGTDPYSAYLIHGSSVAQDLGTLNGRVLKSLEFDSYKGGDIVTPNFAIDGEGILRLHYNTTDGTHVTVSDLRPAAAATASNMSVYWYNGSRWVQLYGALDRATQTMTIRTKFFGRYQLRSVERTGGFSFNQAGLSNRFITPNGDKKNDNVVFTFDNPQDISVTGKILDLRGRVVVGNLPQGPMSNTLIWDGTAGGVPVAGGVYIYQIEGQGQTFTGTVVVIK